MSATETVDASQHPAFAARRGFLKGLASSAVATMLDAPPAQAAAAQRVNVAPVAAFASSFTAPDSRPDMLGSSSAPSASRDLAAGMWSAWPRHDTQWIDYSWPADVVVGQVQVYWACNDWDLGLPRGARLLYWDGADFKPVHAAGALGLAPDAFNSLHFAPVATRRLRLEVEPSARKTAGVLRWHVYTAETPPALPPVIAADVDRSVTLGGVTYLAGRAAWLQQGPRDGTRWVKLRGPGAVAFANAAALETTARFSQPGEYVLALQGTGAGRGQAPTLQVRVVPPPPPKRLDVVYTTPYALDNPLWNARAKALIVNWIPHCIDYCERTDLATGQGGLDNFIEAAKALRGEAHAPHRGYVFSNAWVHQTVESMCLALMVDAQGDAEVLAAQERMRAALERWIPIILAAQEPDGYLQTAYTLASRKDWPERWSPAQRGNHEGYVSGYFIESAINHHTLTGGRDLRLYDAAKRLADCWAANLGPGKKAWFDGHQEMEQALVRFGRFVNDVEGHGRGDAYIALARFLLDSREGGVQYDQSHLPPIRQYEAVGHAVRAMYFYSGMADIAAETGDQGYQSAVLSLWDNMVNRKYYVTGGVGSGDVSEGFGRNYSLRHDGYCESCSSCGLIFFQYKMNLAYRQAKYADLLEETMYNALLGSTSLDGTSFCYTNPLVDTTRARWHSCPCCVGNIPRTLLMLPTWTYAKAADALFVNLFVGSRMQVGKVAGTPVEMVQRTDYPWNGKVALTVNPAEPRRFALHVRVPNRVTSALYTALPAVGGLRRLSVNGRHIDAPVKDGYAVIDRTWAHGDTVAFEAPLAVQRVRGIDRIAATRGQETLRYGPLIYTFETADQPRVDGRIGTGPLKPVWRPDLLGGVVAVEGRWADGSFLRAVPYYARQNRTGRATPEFPATDTGAAVEAGSALDQDSKDGATAQARQLAKSSTVWVGARA